MHQADVEIIGIGSCKKSISRNIQVHGETLINEDLYLDLIHEES